MIVSTHIKGHVHAAYSDNGEVVLDKCNAIHNKNMAIAIARGLSNAAVDGTTGIATNQIYKLDRVKVLLCDCLEHGEYYSYENGEFKFNFERFDLSKYDNENIALQYLKIYSGLVYDK